MLAYQGKEFDWSAGGAASDDAVAEPSNEMWECRGRESVRSSDQQSAQELVGSVSLQELGKSRSQVLDPAAGGGAPAPRTAADTKRSPPGFERFCSGATVGQTVLQTPLGGAKAFGPPQGGVGAAPGGGAEEEYNNEQLAAAGWSRGSGPLAVEIFGSSCRVTRAFRQRGPNAVAVDSKHNRSRPEAICLNIDLCTPQGAALLWRILQQGRVLFIMLAPPCGTATRARERPLPRHLQQAGHKALAPLRSEQYPGGPPGLEGVDKERVDAANKLCRLTAEVCQWASLHTVFWCIENPANSWFWFMPEIAQLLQLPGAQDVVFHNCMHGGSRDKATRFRTNVAELQQPAVLCDKQHEHLPWGVEWKDGRLAYATAEETAYPYLLCDRVAEFVLQAAQRTGVASIESNPDQVKGAAPHDRRDSGQPDGGDDAVRAGLRAAAGRRPRGIRAPELVPEFVKACTLTLRMQEEEQAAQRWQQQRQRSTSPLTLGGVALPVGSRLLEFAAREEWGSAGEPAPKQPKLCPPSRARWRAGQKLGPHQVYVGRGPTTYCSPWANPFRIRNCGSRETCLSKYEEHLRNNPGLLGRLGELAGKELLCHCKQEEGCHADVLIRLFQEGGRDSGKSRPVAPSYPEAGVGGPEVAVGPEVAPSTVKVGVPWTTEQFVELALKCEHPFGTDPPLDDGVKRAIFRILTLGADATTRYRRRALARYRGKAERLEEAERKLHGQMNPDVAKIMQGKRLLLLKELLKKSDTKTRRWPPILRQVLTCLASSWHRVFSRPSIGRPV